MLIVIVSIFLFALLSMNPFFAYASTVPPPAATTTAAEEQPKPGIIMIITFENGTTKAIRSDSTNIQAVNGGYFIADSSLKESQPLQSKTVSKTIVQQLVSVFVDVSIVGEPPTSSEGCGEGFGYYVDDPNPICEPLDKIGQGPPPDQAFCAAFGCPYNPPADSELPVADDEDGSNDGSPNEGFATTPVTPTEEPAVGAQPQPQPEPDPGDGNNNQDGGEEDNQNGDSDGGDGDGNTDEEESEE